jgi:hypothetical protein
MSKWVVFYHAGSAFSCESFKIGTRYLTVLITAHKCFALLKGNEEEDKKDPFSFELVFKSSGHKIDLNDVIDEMHDSSLELRPREKKDGEKSAEKAGVDQEDTKERGQQQEETPVQKTPTGEKEETRRKKKKKDPNAPKRPKTAYQLFCDAHRSQIRQQSESVLSLGQVSAKLSELWKQATAEEKLEYETNAAPAKEKYSKEKKEYEIHLEEKRERNCESEGGSNDFIETPKRQRLIN